MFLAAHERNMKDREFVSRLLFQTSKATVEWQNIPNDNLLLRLYPNILTSKTYVLVFT